MTYNEYANLILEESTMPCELSEIETNIVRNMDWIISKQSTTYQKPDANYLIDPSGISGNAELMYAFTSPGVYYQVGTQVRYGDYIYFRARNLATASPNFEWYLIEYHIPTGNKIIFQVPDMGYHSYTIGQAAQFSPIAPRTLLLYEPYDGFGTDAGYIRKIVFSENSATMSTELEVSSTEILQRQINFFDVVKGSNGHLYGVVYCTEHDIPYPEVDPRRRAWGVYSKDYTSGTQWIYTTIDSLPTWSDIDVWNGCQPMILGDKVVTTNQLEDVDFNDFVTIVTFDVITNTLVKYDWTPGEYRWASSGGPSLSTTSGYFNMVGGTPTNSSIHKLNTLNNEWTLVQDIGNGSPTPYCVIFSSRTHAYFWNTVTQNLYDAETNMSIGNITLPFVSGATQVSFLIDDNDLIWYYESGAVKAKNFDNTIIHNITLTGFTPKTYTNIHLFNNYIVLQTYSAFAGKEQDYYLVK